MTHPTRVNLRFIHLFAIFTIILMMTACGESKDSSTGGEEEIPAQIQIGKVSWYTQQNTFAEIVKIAAADDKPILAVFSAEWCGPCQFLKKSVFAAADFSKVADEAVLLYIEEATDKGKSYVLKNNISYFPTLKLFSQQGVELDTGTDVRRTVPGFLAWLDSVEKGNSLHALSKQLEKNTADRGLALKVIEKMGADNRDDKIERLRKVIQLKPDYDDPIAGQAYELLLSLLVEKLSRPRLTKKQIEEIAQRNHDEFMSVFNAYYPGKFRYRLKGAAQYLCVLRWLAPQGKSKEAVAYIKPLMNSIRKVDGTFDYSILSREVFQVLLESGEEKRAQQLFVSLRDNSDKNNEPLSLLVACETFVKFYGETNNKKEGKKYAGIVLDKVKELKKDRVHEVLQLKYALLYGFFVEPLTLQWEAKLELARTNKESEERIGFLEDGLNRLRKKRIVP
ncbi:MAG: thioredoxin family protein [bacterium]|nr:thioredoxin family protein [bacterium]